MRHRRNILGLMAGFDDIASRLDYPMFVVTTAAGDERDGCLVGFSTQVSIDPQRFLVCLSDKNRTFRLAQHAERLVVHVLGQNDRLLAERFGSETGDEVDKFAGVAWHDGPDGVPVLEGAAGWFSGRIVDTHPYGDHVGFVLEPDAADAADAPDTGALLMFSDVRDLDPGHEA
jgi:flavin reductase (DIM6/NTAB) family NADH-FMN oxidoreductase RutF